MRAARLPRSSSAGWFSLSTDHCSLFTAVYALMNSASTVMWTSSPTRMPPVSRAAFQFRPKSLRLIFVVAERPMRVLPHGSLPGALGPSTLKVTCLRDAVESEVASDLVAAVSVGLDRCGLEGHGGVLLDVEEVGALEVGVALGVAGVDGGDVDGSLDDGEGGIGRCAR